MHKIITTLKQHLTLVLSVFWIILGTVFIYPHVLEHVIPSIVTSYVVFGRGNQGYTLDPLIYTSSTPMDEQISLITWQRKYQAFSSNEQSVDSRVMAVELLLAQHNSPMLSYAQLFVDEADKNGSDWRLAVSISGVETGFGRIIPEGSHNAWGWKGGGGGKFSMWSSWSESIPYIVNRLAEGYGQDVKPHDMESVYCPECGATGLHKWANGVVSYMSTLEYYRQEIEKK